MEIQLTFDDSKVTANIARLKQQAPIAIARALNKSVASGRTVMAREMSKDLGIKVGDVRDKIAVTEATSQRQWARLETKGKRIPLEAFSATGNIPSRGKGRGVSYRLGAQRKRIATAFRAHMASGHTGVFRRTGTKRLPIIELFGPSLPKVFLKFRPIGLARCAEQLRKNLVHEFRFVMSKSA